MTTENAQCVQARAYLAKSLFQDFQMASSISFTLNSSYLLDCLDIFGHAGAVAVDLTDKQPNTSCRMLYDDNNDDLELLLEDQQVVTSCKFAVFDEEDIEPWSFTEFRTLGKVILQSSVLGDALKEFEQNTIIYFGFSHQPKAFIISGKSSSGVIEMSIAGDSELVDFLSAEDTLAFGYKFALLSPIVKFILVSQKTSIRVNDNGMLSIQLMIPTDDKDIPTYVEYLIVAMSNDETDEDEAEEHSEIESE